MVLFYEEELKTMMTFAVYMPQQSNAWVTVIMGNNNILVSWYIVMEGLWCIFSVFLSNL